jgi:twinkle protein
MGKQPSEPITHQPCPDCGSSDALSRYPDGHTYCFSCNKSRRGNGELMEASPNAEYKFFGHRSISPKTFEYYGAYTEFVDEKPTKIGFVYPNKSIKFRAIDRKEFWSEGPMNEAGCFGTDRFDAGSKETVTIVEGEYDALATHEITRGNTATISVRSASSAKRDATRDYEFINSFSKIILAFDSDEPGQTAARSVASLFDFNKVYHVKLNRHKDANAYLEANEADEFVNAWKAARRYAPDNIISTLPEFAKSLQKAKEDIIGTYPFEGLQSRLYGLARGETCVFKGDEGIGKTEIFRAMEHHLLTTTKSNIGIIHLEEDNGTTLRALAGYALNSPVVLPDSNVSNSDVLDALSSLGGEHGRINVHSSFDIEDENAIIDNIRYLVSAANCDFIFMDHISWLATGQDDEDERKKLDRISQRFKLLAKELRFWFGMISHVNDQGKTRGSRNITKVANTVIHLSRDLVNPDENIRNTTYFSIEKARLGGNTGPAGSAIFDKETYTLREVKPIDTIKTPY